MAKTRPEKTTWFRSRLFQLITTLVVLVAVLGAIVWLGRTGLDYLRGSDRYQIAFADIECQPPPGMSREVFLQEAHYYARLPERLNLLDEELPTRLRTGFAKHPWVKQVDDVEIVPPRNIVVKLVHRIPVLAVRTGTTVRAVDDAGILLPANATTTGLPIYEGNAPPPQGPAGTRWGDPKVEAAARKLVTLEEKGKSVSGD